MKASERIAEGRRVLVVEDEMVIALIIEDTLLELGAEIVGPTAHLDGALRLVSDRSIDAAVLDINIGSRDSYPVADILAERNIPFLLCSGYGEWALEQRYRDRPLLTKPFTSNVLKVRLLELLAAPTR